MTFLFAIILFAVILLTLRLIPGKRIPWARDPGPGPFDPPYPMWDKWTWWHILVPLALTFVLCWLGPWYFAVLIVYGVCEGWEWVEGYRSTWDIKWGLVGIACGAIAYGIIV